MLRRRAELWPERFAWKLAPAEYGCRLREKGQEK
jgi:hypothetical protein